MTTFGELCCEVCGVSGSVVAMHRANPKGQKGRWRHRPVVEREEDRRTNRVGAGTTETSGDPRERARKAAERKREREEIRASIEGDAEADYAAWSDAEHLRWLAGNPDDGDER